jgi:hypothetical protein
MIQITLTRTFEQDMDLAIEWLFNFALSESKNFEAIEELFKEEILKVMKSIQSNPFLFQVYSQNNPTRRAIFFHGHYLLEYQIIPVFAKSKNETLEIILTTIVPAKSGRARGDEFVLESLNFDDLED